MKWIGSGEVTSNPRVTRQPTTMGGSSTRMEAPRLAGSDELDGGARTGSVGSCDSPPHAGDRAAARKTTATWRLLLETPSITMLLAPAVSGFGPAAVLE